MALFRFATLLVFLTVAGALHEVSRLGRAEAAVPASPSPAASPQAGWATYRNETFGFQLRYPALFDENDDFVLCRLTEWMQGHFRVGARIDILVVDAAGASLLEFADAYISEQTSDEFGWTAVDAVGWTTVSGREAVSISYRFGGLSRLGVLTLVEHAGWIFLLNVHAGPSPCVPDSEPPLEFGIYEELLASFEFFDPTP